MSFYRAISISQSIALGLRSPHFRARVLASFERVCDLINPQGEIIALVHPDVGNGPLNVVVEPPPPFAHWPAGTPVHGDGLALEVPGLGTAIKLEGAREWNPAPDWARLAAGEQLRGHLEHLQAIVVGHRPDSWGVRAEAAMSGLIAALAAGDLDGVRRHAAALCGLGPGLTPMGDDWLAGWLVGLRLAFPDSDQRAVGEAVLEAARGRTTALSLAFLRCAARGELSEPWHKLLAALADGTVAEVETAAASVLGFGATSGAAMLTGFLSAFHPFVLAEQMC